MKSMTANRVNSKYVTRVKLPIFAISVFFAISGCSFFGLKQTNSIKLSNFERSVAQKMILDMRYFCKDIVDPKLCKEPVTSLPPELAQMITDTSIGGVVLFSQNIISPQQVFELTKNMQTAALSSPHGNGLFIAVDQEGGQVVRLPRKDATSFAGNMAIGATYKKFGTRYASDVGQIIGSELKQLGINLNFSPDIDVNTNPDNPIINIRSFGKDPKIVGELGIAMMKGIQRNNVVATLKHFPGHGNTSVDSHTGLPKVNYDQKTIDKNDIQPFKMAIENASPGMIMTAHIQYPQLDSSNIISRQGQSIVRPATMSKKILTNLLRKRLNFKGVVITDALDMKSISENFSPIQATVEAYKAGADIALMPFTIRSNEDITRFKYFVRKVSEQIQSNQLMSDRVKKSEQRILALKQQFKLDQVVSETLDVESRISTDKHRNVEWQLAVHSVTGLESNASQLPLGTKGENKIHLVAEDQQQIDVFSRALNHYWPFRNEQTLELSSSFISDWRHPEDIEKLQQAQSIIILFKGAGSLAVNGEKQKLNAKGPTRASRRNSENNETMKLLNFTRRQGINSVLIAVKSPYAVRDLTKLANSTLFTYDPSIYTSQQTGQLVGVSFDAAAALLVGMNEMTGDLPVSLHRNDNVNKTKDILSKTSHVTNKSFSHKINATRMVE